MLENSVDVHIEGFVHWGKNAEITTRHHEEPTPKINFWYQDQKWTSTNLEIIIRSRKILRKKLSSPFKFNDFKNINTFFPLKFMTAHFRKKRNQINMRAFLYLAIHSNV